MTSLPFISGMPRMGIINIPTVFYVRVNSKLCLLLYLFLFQFKNYVCTLVLKKKYSLSVYCRNADALTWNLDTVSVLGFRIKICFGFFEGFQCL